MDGEVGRDRNTTYSSASSSTTPRAGFTTPLRPQLGMAQYLDRLDELAEVHVQHPPRRAPVMSSPAMMTNAWVSRVSRHASSAASTPPPVPCSWARRQLGRRSHLTLSAYHLPGMSPSLLRQAHRQNQICA
jgi:hypothetical protein